MPPQNESVMESGDYSNFEQKPKQGSLKLLAALTLVAVAVTAAVFAVTSPSQGLVDTSMSSAVNQVVLKGDDLPQKDDCNCIDPCYASNKMTTAGTNAYYCRVYNSATGEGNTDCMGTDYEIAEPFAVMPEVGSAYSTMIFDFNRDGTFEEATERLTSVTDYGLVAQDYYAACTMTDGLYNCWSFPCMNGGYCLDAAIHYGTEGLSDESTFQCVCPFGWEGKQCTENVNECSFVGNYVPTETYDQQRGTANYEDETIRNNAKPVCDENAECIDMTPDYPRSVQSYDCNCKSGFNGDGYQKDQSRVRWGSVLKRGQSYQPSYGTDNSITRDTSGSAGCEDFTCMSYRYGWLTRETEMNIIIYPADGNQFECSGIAEGGAITSACVTATGVEVDTIYTLTRLYEECAVRTMTFETGSEFLLDVTKESGIDFQAFVKNSNGMQGNVFIDTSVSDATDPQAGTIRAAGATADTTTINIQIEYVETDNIMDGCTDINDCSSNPCRNGATCIDVNNEPVFGEIGEPNWFYCDCSSSFPEELWINKEGDFLPGPTDGIKFPALCVDNVNECETGQATCGAPDRATCTDTPGSYTCSCNANWQGDGYDPAKTMNLSEQSEAFVMSAGGTGYTVGEIITSDATFTADQVAEGNEFQIQVLSLGTAGATTGPVARFKIISALKNDAFEEGTTYDTTSDGSGSGLQFTVTLGRSIIQNYCDNLGCGCTASMVHKARQAMWLASGEDTIPTPVTFADVTTEETYATADTDQPVAGDIYVSVSRDRPNTATVGTDFDAGMMDTDSPMRIYINAVTASDGAATTIAGEDILVLDHGRDFETNDIVYFVNEDRRETLAITLTRWEDDQASPGVVTMTASAITTTGTETVLDAAALGVTLGDASYQAIALTQDYTSGDGVGVAAEISAAGAITVTQIGAGYAVGDLVTFLDASGTATGDQPVLMVSLTTFESLATPNKKQCQASMDVPYDGCTDVDNCHTTIELTGDVCTCGTEEDPYDWSIPCTLSGDPVEASTQYCAVLCDAAGRTGVTTGPDKTICTSIREVQDKCFNGGECVEITEGPEGNAGEYRCDCLFGDMEPFQDRGWKGSSCEEDINECEVMDPEKQGCGAYAHCVNTEGSWMCECDMGWTGDAYSACVDADDCEFGPCAHGGTCEDCGTLCYLCECIPGWRGKSCEIDWNECQMGIHKCHDYAICTNTPGSYSCACESGFSGDGYLKCENLNDCMMWEDDPDTDDSTLVDYSIMQIVKGKKVYSGQQISPAPWMDDRPVLAADGSTDINDEVVTDAFYVHQCGEYDSNTRIFKEHGVCTDLGVNAWTCDCKEGWSDSNCDLNVNECARGIDECHKYATCTDNPGSYTCECNLGYSGDGSNVCYDIDDCAVGTAKCSNGYCTDMGTLAFKCTCEAGYEDTLCDADIDECSTMTHQCHEDAICINSPGSYSCECRPGNQGDGNGALGCEDIDDCGVNPCQNGKCKDVGADSYVCECDEGWTDTNCDADYNECYAGTHNCHEDAKCVNTKGRFYCRCLAGWQGDGYTCTDLDDCDPDPCDPVHGTCMDTGPNKHVCSCEGGWGGCLGTEDGYCGTDENECECGTHGCDRTEPTGNCKNTQGGHLCFCSVGDYGDGKSCNKCTNCKEQLGPGYKKCPDSACDLTDNECCDIDECQTAYLNNCDENAQCRNTDGSFTCECKIEGGFEYWGTGVTCSECTKCGVGERMVSDCTSTQDRVCEIAIPDGDYVIETKANAISQCLIQSKEPNQVFPVRYNWGGKADSDTSRSDMDAGSCEDPLCGVCDWDAKSIKENIIQQGVAVWKFMRLEKDSYLILSDNDGQGYRCLGFADEKGGYPQPMAVSSTTAKASIKIQEFEFEGMCADFDESATGTCAYSTDTKALNEEAEGYGLVECGEVTRSVEYDEEAEADIITGTANGTPCNTDADCSGIDMNNFADQKCHTLPPEISYYWNVEQPGVEENMLHNDENGDPSYFCGFPDKASLFENPKGVWRVKQLGCKAEPDYCAERRFEDMYILQSYGAGDANNNGEFDFRDAQCMYFPINSGNVDEEDTHPRRVPSEAFCDEEGWCWGQNIGTVTGNDEDNGCGLGLRPDLGTETQEESLMTNQRAVFKLINLVRYG